MHHTRGFASLIVLLILAASVVLVGTGAHYLTRTGSSTSVPSASTTPTVHVVTAQTASTTVASSGTIQTASSVSSGIPAENKSTTAPASTTVKSNGTTKASVPPPPIPSQTGTTTGSVIGYIWTSDPGSPKFAKVEVAIINDANGPSGLSDTYYLYIYENGSFQFYKEVKPLDTVVFPKGGVSKFELLGVDPALGICATDHHVWGLHFTNAGTFQGTEVKLTTSTPNQKCVDAEVYANTPAVSTTNGDLIRLVNLQILQYALDDYFSEHHQYPAQLSALVAADAGIDASEIIDPTTKQPLLYAGLASATSTACVGYHLGAVFEASDDPYIPKAAHAAASSHVCTGSDADFSGSGTIVDVTNTSDPNTLHR